MPIKLTSREYRVIAIAVVLAAVSLAIAVKYFWRAFPEASLSFRVNKAASETIAERFLSDRGVKVEGYRHAAIFSYDDEAKLYLERTQGLARTNDLASGPVHLWRWSHRWFRPQQKEEFRVDVTPDGQVVAFDHELAEAAPGARLDQAQARRIADRFLSEVTKRDLGDLEFVEGGTEKRPARADHTFTWKQRSVSLGDGSQRLSVEVAGDQVSGYQEFVKVPDAWTRDYEKLRSRNDSAQGIDQVFWILLSVAMLIILVMRLRDRDVPARMAAKFGAVGAVLYFLGQMNSFQLSEFSYPTTDPFSSFVASYLRDALASSVAIGALIFLLVAAAEPMYREGLPRLVSLRCYLSWKGLRTRSFFIANIVGLGLTFIFFAYQTIFYITANKLGAWAPSEVPFTDELNTAIPWVGVLFMGFLPAVSEEMQFRAFAIPFLSKYLRSWPLAIVLAAFNWSFLHSVYPNQPFFIRGLEVGIAGVVMGLIMMRFGIVATLIWHYSVDALYTAFLFLRSHDPYLMISGGITAGIMLVPLVVALVAYLRTGTFAEEESLTNGAEGVRRLPQTETRLETASPLRYRQLDSHRLKFAAVIVVAFVAAAFVPAYRFGEGLKVRATRDAALRAADEFLAAQHVNAASYRHVAWLEQNIEPRAIRYMLLSRSVQDTDRIYRLGARPLTWAVRYFRSLEKEEWLVVVDATTGRVSNSQHTIADDTPGASLSDDAAQTLATQALADHGLTRADFELKESQAKKQKARVDYQITWQAKPADARNVGDAHYRAKVDIAGDQVVGFSHFLKLPEDWLRVQETTRLANVVLRVFRYALLVGLVGAGLVLFVVQVRRGQVPWRQAAWGGVLLLGVQVLASAGRLPLVDQGYITSIPLSTYRLFIVITLILAPIIVGLLGWFLIGLATSLYPDAWRILQGVTRRAWARDAAVAIALSVSAAAGLGSLEMFFSDRFHAYAPVSVDLLPESFDSFFPGGEAFFLAVFHAVVATALAAIVIRILRLGWQQRAWWLWPGALVLLISLGRSDAHSLAEYFASWVMTAVPLAVAVLLIAYYFRDNVLAYLAAVFCVEIAEPLVSLLSSPLASYCWQGVVLAALSAALLAWLFLAGWKSQAASAEASSPSG